MTNRPARGCPFGFSKVADPDAAPSPDRRRLLLGLGAGAAGGALAFGSPAVAQPQDAAPVKENDGTKERQPFYGRRQAGVVTAQPAVALFVAFDVLAENRADLQRLFAMLTERIAFLMRGGPSETADPRLPPPDSGLLGPEVIPDNLTVTVSVGASLFDGRFGLQAQRPTALVPMAHFPNDTLAEGMTHGDLLLQFCANTAETTIHALRDILKHGPDLLALRWKMEGFLPPHTIKSLGRDTVRNLLGFKDGTANLDAHDEALMDRQVWVAGGSDEPLWARDGSYQVVRLIRCLVERWDRTTLVEQQQIIGRDKVVGAPLGKTNERDLPDYDRDPKGETVRLDAHIRLANPRTPDTDSSLILRRSYNYSNGLTKAGQLDMGLLFCCYQSDLSAGFAAVQARLNGEPLEEYIKPIGGGYFFVLPGVTTADRFLGQGLFEHSA